MVNYNKNPMLVNHVSYYLMISDTTCENWLLDLELGRLAHYGCRHSLKELPGITKQREGTENSVHLSFSQSDG